MLAFVRDFVRWRTWYDSKIPFFLACMYYSALSTESSTLQTISDMAVLLLVICLYASFGYSINSLSDRIVDRSASKFNALILLSDKTGKLLVCGIAAAGLGIVILAFHDQPFVAVLFYIAFLTATAYSLPPLRFKERGFLGLLVSAVSQRTLPIITIFQVMNAWDWPALALSALGTVIGVRSIIVHQLVDEAADKRAGVRTVATVRGSSILRRLLKRLVFPVELAVLGGAVALMSKEYMVVGLVFLAYAFWSGLQLAARHPARDNRFSRFSPRILADWYYLYWPLLLAAVLVEQNAAYLPVFMFTIAWVLRRLRNEAHYTYQFVAGWRTPPSPG